MLFSWVHASADVGDTLRLNLCDDAKPMGNVGILEGVGGAILKLTVDRLAGDTEGGWNAFRAP